MEYLLIISTSERQKLAIQRSSQEWRSEGYTGVSRYVALAEGLAAALMVEMMVPTASTLVA